MAHQAWPQYPLQLKYGRVHESLKPVQSQGLQEDHLLVIQDYPILICKHKDDKALLDVQKVNFTKARTSYTEADDRDDEGNI